LNKLKDVQKKCVHVLTLETSLAFPMKV